MTLKNISELSPAEIEGIERLTLRWLFQAAVDFGSAATEIFHQSPDEVKDVAEDVTREMLDSLSGFNVSQRIYGTVDYKKARYIILPDMAVRQVPWRRFSRQGLFQAIRTKSPMAGAENSV